MITLRSCQSLDNLNESEARFLLEREFKSKVHPGREETYLLAREALRLAFCAEGINLGLKKIILKTYGEMQDYPDYTLSLAHTHKCGVAALAKRSEFLAVGVDVEDESRPIKDTLIQKITHPRDTALRNIEIWILKEAVFKCLSNSGKLTEQPLYTEIEILKDGWSHSPSGLTGDWEIRELKPFLVALSTVRI